MTEPLEALNYILMYMNSTKLISFDLRSIRQGIKCIIRSSKYDVQPFQGSLKFETAHGSTIDSRHDENQGRSII